MTRLTQTADVAIPELAGLQRRLLLAGAVGAAVSLVGAYLDIQQFMQSYLMAYMLCLGVTLGCLALGMVHQLSGGAWGVVIRRPIGAATRTLPVMTLLFLPALYALWFRKSLGAKASAKEEVGRDQPDGYGLLGTPAE